MTPARTLIAAAIPHRVERDYGPATAHALDPRNDDDSPSLDTQAEALSRNPSEVCDWLAGIDWNPVDRVLPHEEMEQHIGWLSGVSVGTLLTMIVGGQEVAALAAVYQLRERFDAHAQGKVSGAQQAADEAAAADAYLTSLSFR